MTELFSSQGTIAAISTPPGAGGIGIIRISGEQSLPVLKEIFVPKDPTCSFTSHRFYYGHIQRTVDQKILDEVLTVYLKPGQEPVAVFKTDAKSVKAR